MTPSTCYHRSASAVCPQVRAFPDDDSLRHFRDWVNLPPAALMGPDGQAVEGAASATFQALLAASTRAAHPVCCVLPAIWLALIAHASAHDFCCPVSIGSPRAAACGVCEAFSIAGVWCRGGRGLRGHAALQEGAQKCPQGLDPARHLPQPCGHCRVHVSPRGHCT